MMIVVIITVLIVVALLYFAWDEISAARATKKKFSPRPFIPQRSGPP
jgi:hypothetical protein